MVLNQVGRQIDPAVLAETVLFDVGGLMHCDSALCTSSSLKDLAEIGLEPFGGVGRIVTQCPGGRLTLSEAAKTKKFWILSGFWLSTPFANRWRCTEPSFLISK